MKTVLFFLASWPLFSADSISLDKTRPHLNSLKEKIEIKQDNYEFPYLIMQTARVFEGEPSKVKEKVERELQQNRVTPDKNTDFDPLKLAMPEVFSKEEQLEAIEACTIEKCNMKLLLEEEGKKLQGTESKLKVGAYHQIVLKRINGYLKTGALKGYEQRENNESAVIEMAKSQEFLKYKYPEAAKFVFNKEWKNRQGYKKSVKNSFIVNEMVLIAPEKLQPLWRIGEVFEFEEKGNRLFLYLPIYTNHYFDASITFYEVIPYDTKSIVIITDVLEVDELKKSGFIRALFKGKMVDAVSLSQDTFLKKLM